MKRIVVCLIVMLAISLNLAFAGGTNRWVSDGSEYVLTPSYYFWGVTVVTAIPWGDVTTPPFNEKIEDDGAVWISTSNNGWASDGTGDYWFVRSITPVPSGETHSRMTFWGCADDEIISIVLDDGVDVQNFYPPTTSDGNDADEIIRIDMSDAEITPGDSYNFWVQVENSACCRVGLMYYLSVDYDQELSFDFEWNSGWALHSLPFRVDLSENSRLIDIFPDASQALIWVQEQNNYQSVSTSATLTGDVGDSVRYHSVFILHTSSSSSEVYGWPIYEQRFLDIRPEDQPSLYRHIGTVYCSVPFDCDPFYCEPDDLPDCGIDEGYRWNQSTSNYVAIDDIEPFTGSNYGTGYMILYDDLDNAHLDLRCYEEEALMASTPMEEPPDIPDEIREIMEERAYLHAEFSEEETTIVETEPTPEVDSAPRDPGPPPMPPNYRPKKNSVNPTQSSIETWATPNPFNSSVEIHVSLPDYSHEMEITIIDINGREIRKLSSYFYNENGDCISKWDGKDNHGQNSPTGVYYYKINSGDQRATGTLLLTK